MLSAEADNNLREGDWEEHDGRQSQKNISLISFIRKGTDAAI